MAVYSLMPSCLLNEPRFGMTPEVELDSPPYSDSMILRLKIG